MTLFKMPKILKQITDEEHEMVEEKATELATDESLDKFLKSIKISDREEYLENWRKNYIERIDQLINWGIRNPKDFSDVIAILWRFEEFYGNMIMLVAKSETMKQFFGTNPKLRGPEIG